jgi:hypothetical protein
MVSWRNRRIKIDPAANDAGVEALDPDALAGAWHAADADPHYEDLPCYVPLDVDDGGSPFSDADGAAPNAESPARAMSRAHGARARRLRST